MLGWEENVDEFERVEEGVTGPRERREAAKEGSEASRAMEASFVEEARGAGWTVGPGEVGWPGSGEGEEAALVLEEEGDGLGGRRVGYWRRRVAAEAVLAAALEAEEPIWGGCVEGKDVGVEYRDGGGRGMFAGEEVAE